MCILVSLWEVDSQRSLRKDLLHCNPPTSSRVSRISFVIKGRLCNLSKESGDNVPPRTCRHQYYFFADDLNVFCESKTTNEAKDLRVVRIELI